MRGERDHADAEDLNGQPVGRWSLCSLSRAEMKPPGHPDDCAGETCEHKVQQQNPLQLLPLELELPRDNAGGEGWNCRNRCRQQVVVGRIRKAASFRPVSAQLEHYSGDEKCDWKMNKHNVLCMFRQQCRFEIKGIHDVFSSTFGQTRCSPRYVFQVAGQAPIWDNRSGWNLFLLRNDSLRDCRLVTVANSSTAANG